MGMNRRTFLAQLGKTAAAASAVRIAQGQAASSLCSHDISGVRIGAQVEKSSLMNPAYAQLIASNFDLITAGNELKWARLRPKPEIFNFSDGDWMVRYCKSNRLRLHGHNLCWVSANPQWLDRVVTKTNAAYYLSEHVAKVVARYKGKIESWDVVNEPLDSRSSRPDLLKEGIWSNLLGPLYIDVAFHAAAAADPSALRVLNIYEVEQDYSMAAKMRTATVALVKQLISRGVPIQAIGLESHLDGKGSLARTGRQQFLQQLRDLGMQILITECDVDDTRLPTDIATRDRDVANVYKSYLEDTIADGNVKRVIFWTPCDKGNWYDADSSHQRADGLLHRPGLWAANMSKKSSWYAVASVI